MEILASVTLIILHVTGEPLVFTYEGPAAQEQCEAAAVIVNDRNRRNAATGFCIGTQSYEFGE